MLHKLSRRQNTCPVYSLLFRNVFACFGQGHDCISEDRYPWDPTEITSKFHADLCRSGGIHLAKLALRDTIRPGIRDNDLRLVTIEGGSDGSGGVSSS